MTELFWDGNFEWIENEPLTDEQRQGLTHDQIIQRELVLAKYMAAYKGKWIMVKDQIILTYANTLHDALERKHTENVDYVHKVPEENRPFLLYSQVA